ESVRDVKAGSRHASEAALDLHAVADGEVRGNGNNAELGGRGLFVARRVLDRFVDGLLVLGVTHQGQTFGGVRLTSHVREKTVGRGGRGTRVALGALGRRVD